MSSADDIAAWDKAATTYAEAVGGEADSFFRRFKPFLDAQVPDWEGRRVLTWDVGTAGWRACWPRGERTCTEWTAVLS